jgi:transposase
MGVGRHHTGGMVIMELRGVVWCGVAEDSGDNADVFGIVQRNRRRCTVAKIRLEATGRLWVGIALHLHRAGHWVSVVNQAQIKHFIRSKLTRSKTDRIACGGIREFAETFDPAPWTPPSQALEDLRDLMGTRDQLVAMATALSNRLGCGHRNETAAGIERQVLETLRHELKQLETAIDAVLRQDARFNADHTLLVSIPGIGAQAAAVVLAEMPGPRAVCE